MVDLLCFFKAKCSVEPCLGEISLRTNDNMGWRVGTKIPPDPSNPAFGRCPHCKRYSLVITEVPSPPPPPQPKGWDKIPTS